MGTYRRSDLETDRVSGSALNNFLKGEGLDEYQKVMAFSAQHSATKLLR